jgi:hypothetical protein
VWLLLFLKWLREKMTFPVNVNVSWDANPTTDGVTNYNVYFNNTLTASPTTTSQIVAVPSAGTYTFGVSAVNQWGESDQTTVTVTINAAGKPANVKVTKA